MKIVSIFNNKGGVGKTTYLFHLAHLLEKKDNTVLVVDLDSQCNISSYFLPDELLEKSWKQRGNSIWNAIKDVYGGVGDIKSRGPTQVNPDNYPQLYLVPGDVMLSNYEDVLGDSWNAARGGAEPALRQQSAIYRYVLWCANKVGADIVLLDLGPNLGPLNRAALSFSDYFIVPVSPDLFSIRGTENLGNKLQAWRHGWEQCNAAWQGERDIDLPLPLGKPKFAGYVTQQHNLRNNADGMTRGWSIFGERVESAIVNNIVGKLNPHGQVVHWDDGNWNLGMIPNLHSLVPYSLEAKKPIFDCNSADGLTGSHIARARDSIEHYQPIAATLDNLISK